VSSLAAVTARAWRENRLFSVLLELTYRCNLDCAFCYNDLSLRGVPLSLDSWRRALDEIAELGALHVVLSGGEPLAHPDFFAIGAHARARGFVTRVKSNGHGLTAPVARRLVEQVDPFMVEVSLHGARPQSHDRQTRVPGSFERLVRNIGAMREAGLRVKLNATLTTWNEDEVEAMFAIADRLGVSLQFDPEVTPRDDGDRTPQALTASPEGLQRLFRAEFARGARLEAAGSRDADRTEPSPAPVTTDRHCGAGSSSLAIDPYGNVYPCVQWRRPIGNLHDTPLTSLWGGSAALADVRAATVEVKRRLAGREDRALLNFCPGLAEATSGDAGAVYPGAERRAAAVRQAQSEWQPIALLARSAE
jgi:MoaA/NifB/PqqE/SkfB family radical SAM enzyme